MIQAFHKTDRPSAPPKSAPSPTDTTLGQPLRCAACLAEVTSDQACVDGGGRFTNPAGVTYDVVCFSSAPGCYIQGDPIVDFSWFPGHAWCFALCGACHQHLGWYYQGPSKFFGLIRDRLVSPAADR